MGKRTLLKAATLALLTMCTPARAQIVLLHSVKVVLSSETLQGYITMLADDKFDPAKPDAMSILKKYPTTWLFEDLRQTAPIPKYGQINFLTKPQRIIKTKDIRAVKPYSLPLNGHERGMIPGVVTARQARLLAKPPKAFCVANTGLYWFSYKDEIDQDRLDEMCKDSLEDAKESVAKYPDVFTIQMEGGD